MTKLLAWFDGNKTIIGGFLIAFSLFLQQQVEGTLAFHPDWVNTLISILQWIGGLLGSAGVVHKIIKGASVPVDAAVSEQPK